MYELYACGHMKQFQIRRNVNYRSILIVLAGLLDKTPVSSPPFHICEFVLTFTTTSQLGLPFSGTGVKMLCALSPFILMNDKN